jgi:DNA-binding NtrC family response regulator
MITGESGTGKELVARALHDYGKRRSGPFVAINMAAIPRDLIESELFGHEKGSFTGAIARRAGRFEQADGGTLFLDEIGDMPLSVQVKLLRVLQDGTFSRVGSNETLSGDVRIVTATNKVLSNEVAACRFREDLYYRLNVVEIRLPPLRERAEDIPLLAEFFLQRITRKNGMARIRLSAEAIAALQQHRWPGNVRELENTIARACALASSTVLLPSDIPLAAAPGSEKGALRQSLTRILDSVPAGENALTWLTRELATCALERHDGDLKEAASELGMGAAELRKILASGNTQSIASAGEA